MTRPIRLLHLEDNPCDPEIIRHRLDVGSVPGRPLRLVLLIEVSARDSEIIQHQFCEAGAICTFTVHRRLSDALNELRSGKGKFDLILLDLGLPDKVSVLKRQPDVQQDEIRLVAQGYVHCGWTVRSAQRFVAGRVEAQRQGAHELRLIIDDENRSAA